MMISHFKLFRLLLEDEITPLNTRSVKSKRGSDVSCKLQNSLFIFAELEVDIRPVIFEEILVLISVLLSCVRVCKLYPG